MAQDLSIPPTLLDTDTHSNLMRRHPQVVRRAIEYRQVYGRLAFSIMSRYEILSGLKARRAVRRIADFDRFCATSTVLPITDEVIEAASETYAALHRRGELIGDADILIAATALVAGLRVATNNERHFRRISDLVVENWLR